MYLKEGTEIKGYSIVNFAGRKDEAVIYEVIKNISGERLYVCEYFPEEISERNEDGTVNILNSSAYTKGLSYFRSRSDTIRSIGFKEIIKVKEAFSFNNTYYVFYGISEGKNLLEYIEGMGGKINYKNAYSLLSPLIRSLNYMFNNNVFFRPTVENIKYMPDNSVILDDFYLSDYSFMYCIEDLANVFYSLITGKKYGDILERPSKAGGYLPKRLDDILYDTLFSNVSYASLEDFLNKLTDSVIFDNTMVGEENYSEKPPLRLDTLEPALEKKKEIPSPAPDNKDFHVNEVKGEYVESLPPNNPPQNIYSDNSMYTRSYNSPPKKNNNKLLIGCIGGGCLSLIILFIVIIFAARAFFGIARSYSTDVTEFAEEYITDYSFDESEEYSEDYLEEGNVMAMTMAYTSYEYYDTAFDNTVIAHEDFIYFRHWDGEQWGIARYHKDDEGSYEMIATDVMASFMQIKDNTLYFVNSLENNYIFSIDLNEISVPALIINQKAAFIQIHNDKIYYINLDDGFFIYRANMDGSENELFNPVDTSAMAFMEDELIYLGYDEEGGTALFTINVNTLNESFISAAWARNIICKDGMIYYIDYSDDSFHGIDILGNEIEPLVYDSVFSFDFLGDTIYYIDLDFNIKSLNTLTEETEIYPFEAYYLQAAGGKMFYYDYYDELLHRIDQNGEAHSLYQGYPVYPESMLD